MKRGPSLKDASHLYSVERSAIHAAREDFRILELQLSPSQQIPWHLHQQTQDTFYVLKGALRIFLQDPKEDIVLEPGNTYTVRPERPHLVTNASGGSTTFLVLQGIGSYDYVPLTSQD